MEKRIDFYGFLLDGSKKTPFHVSVYRPVKSDNDDYFCKIRCEELFRKDKKIFGVDEVQAYELAIEFIVSVLGDRKITDDKGLEVDLRAL
jgi:hypothetical protein